MEFKKMKITIKLEVEFYISCNLMITIYEAKGARFIVDLGPVCIDLFELSYWHKFSKTVWENLLKQLDIVHKLFSVYFHNFSKIAYENSL